MKRVNKILISIFLMSILVTTITTNAKDTAIASASENITNTTRDVAVPEIQESILPTPEEEKSRFENRIRNIPQSLTNISIKSAVSAPSDINYTNPITGISVFGTDFNYASLSIGYAEWNRYTFYLPTASYIYIDISGRLSSFLSGNRYDMYIDNEYLNSGIDNGICNVGTCDLTIKTSRLTYLTKGWHTLYLSGQVSGAPSEAGFYVAGFISIMTFPEYTAITVTSPNGGESWAKGTTKSITWKKDGQPGANVKIELYKVGALSSVISSITPNDGQYSWYIPTYTPIGTDYKIKISSTSEPTKYYDWSNNNFRIY